MIDVPEREVWIKYGTNGAIALQKRLVAAKKLLKQIGALLVRDSRQAFQDQRFGEIPWPEKYPGSPKPFISIAGIVQDFNEGGTKPRPETLNDRPALQRTTALRNSPSYRFIDDHTIELGSQLPYAGLHQQGGWSSQPVTEDTKTKIENWLDVKKRKKVFAPDYISHKEFSSWARSQGYGYTAKKRSKSGNETVLESPNAVYAGRLQYLLRPSTTQLDTQVHSRPFVGVTGTRADQVGEMISNFVANGGTEGSST